MDARTRHTAFPVQATRTDLDPDRLLAALRTVASAPNPQGPHVTLDEAHPDCLIEVAEHERITATRLTDLLDLLERAATPADPSALEQAVRGWLDTRPVSDPTAATRGIATLGWSQRLRRVTWRVVVPRPSGVLADWVPTVHTPPETVRAIRADALARSRRLTVTPLHTGEVTVWVYLVNPALSTAVLSQPDSLANGETVEDLFAVFTPGRPVAVAHRTPAIRLTEESTEPHMMLPLADLDHIGWT